MLLSTRADRSAPRGQILVFFAIAVVAIIAVAGLVIEAGNVFGQQRIAQNGADAASTAGAVVVAESLSGKPRTGADVALAVNTVVTENSLGNPVAEYTDDFGVPIGAAVDAALPIPTDARGVRVQGDRGVETTFARVIAINDLKATAEATTVAGALSLECVADEDGCALLPLTFPVKVFECDESGTLLGGQWVGAPPPGHETEGYWPIVGEEDLPSAGDPDGNPDTEAILPLCKASGESTGAYGFLDLVSGMNLQQEITGPLNTTFNLPDWYQVQTGNPNSVEDELEEWLHTPILIPLHNQACREDPGDTEICPPGMEGIDPVGSNTWYYIHTLAVFWTNEVLVQGSDVDACASPPGSPQVPVTTGAGFLGCLKGWFVSYVTTGPIIPGGDIIPGVTPIGIQLIK
ncbi:MAG TPA: pilus assembly protein TadG-related protein [Candidatus Limnocylindrales bacterium]|nr:pilus assembly protein TadG-related protein [Candidatus Limnocylindrales bacterium]